MKFSEHALMALSEQSIKVILFDGKKESWNIWEEKHLARAKKKGFKDVLLETAVVPKDGEDLEEKASDNDVTKKEKKMLREMKTQNELAHDDLIVSMDDSKSGGKVAFNIIRNTKDKKDYPHGNAKVAWEKLKKKCAPTSAPNSLEVHREFCGAKFKKHWAPDAFITNMEELRGKMENMGHKMDEK